MQHPGEQQPPAAAVVGVVLPDGHGRLGLDPLQGPGPHLRPQRPPRRQPVQPGALPGRRPASKHRQVRVLQVRQNRHRDTQSRVAQQNQQYLRK